MVQSKNVSFAVTLLYTALVAALPHESRTLPPGSSIVNLRIEGATNTIYEAPILSGPRNVTTPSAGTHKCDGTNNGANPSPGNTCTDALDAASKLLKFPFDGTYSTTFDDFFITSIGTSTQTASQFWGLLLNYQFTPVGGCQQQVQRGDDVLWAFDAFSKTHFLKVTPDALVVKKGGSRTVTVRDGLTGGAIEGAVINGVMTDADGKAKLSFLKSGVFEFKATRDDSLRSNALRVVVA
ncbi:MAG: hypothetical protein Q9216_004065 [Gyalolechia sp. 2 TL-2023]